MASDSKFINDVNEVKGQKVKSIRGPEKVLGLAPLLQHPSSAGWVGGREQGSSQTLTFARGYQKDTSIHLPPASLADPLLE